MGDAVEERRECRLSELVLAAGKRHRETGRVVRQCRGKLDRCLLLSLVTARGLLW